MTTTRKGWWTRMTAPRPEPAPMVTIGSLGDRVSLVFHETWDEGSATVALTEAQAQELHAKLGGHLMDLAIGREGSGFEAPGVNSAGEGPF